MSLSHLKSAKELEVHFFAKLTEIIARQAVGVAQAGIAVAYSGGIDSSVLLHLTHQYCVKNQIPVFAFHVNHGLSSQADQWQHHCQENCQTYFEPIVEFEATRVQVDNDGLGIEAAARTQRYRALGTMCSQHQQRLLLTAHHMDDQAETMLLQLVRGTGLRGLGGMDDFNYAAELFGTPEVLLARPLLKLEKLQLSQYALTHNLSCVNDESNDQVTYKRNAIRHLVMPAIEEVAPGFVKRFSRTADHVRAANALLEQLARTDLAYCVDETGMDIVKLKELSVDRINAVFRQWLLSKNIKLPATAKLQEMLSQVLHARPDARVSVEHADYALHRHDGKIYLVQRAMSEDVFVPISYQWQGECSQYFPQLQGSLIFVPAPTGIDAALLRTSILSIRVRAGGERLRLDKKRSSRDMKSHFQTARIPFWQRKNLPFIYIGDQLMFVGLLGMDAAFIADTGEQNRQIVWIPNPA